MTSIFVSFPLYGQLPSFLARHNASRVGFISKTYHIASATKISKTMVVFETSVCGHEVVIADGGAKVVVVDAEGEVAESAPACADSVSCGALQVDGSEEEARLKERAQADLDSVGDVVDATEGRRRLSEGCYDPAGFDVQQASQWEGCSSVACGEARKFHNECDGDAACFEGKVCSDSRVCATWKSANCGGARQLFATGEVTKMRGAEISRVELGSPLVRHCL